MAHYPEGSSTKFDKTKGGGECNAGRETSPRRPARVRRHLPQRASGKLELYGQSADSKGKAHMGLTRWRPPPSTEMRREAPAPFL